MGGGFYSENNHTGYLFVATGSRAVGFRKSVGGKSRPFCFNQPSTYSHPNTGATINFRQSTTELHFWVAGVEHARVTKSQAGTRTRPEITDISQRCILRHRRNSVCMEVLACSLWEKSVPSYPDLLSQTREQVSWWVYLISVLSDGMWHKGSGHEDGMAWV